MPSLKDIQKPIVAEMSHYEEYLRRSLHSDNTLVSTMLEYVFSNRGKGIRPLMVLLSAAMHAGAQPLGERSYLAAMLIEMIHTASLVHDDVIDEANVRRGKPSVNALWRSHRAVLIGDYILAQSYTTGMESSAFDIVSYITKCMGEICEGELIQSDQSDRLEMTREIYFDIIYKKTATLLGTSSGVGALSVGASTEQVQIMKEFGDNLGMAFQIKDDILDYTPTAHTGKPSCGDLKERKITLPLLTVLEKSSDTEAQRLLQLLSDVRKKPSNASYLCKYVTDHGGLEMAAKIMNYYTEKARAQLSLYSESSFHASLDQLCTFLAERDQ